MNGIKTDSNKCMQYIFGHETGHLTDNMPERHKLDELIKKFNPEKYNEMLKETKSLYKSIEGADFEKETINNLIGEYVYGEPKFVERLTQEPTLFNKIKNLVDDLVIKFKGTQEEKDLREIQKTFEKMYRKISVEENKKLAAKYHLSANALNDVTNAITETAEHAKNNSAQFVKLKDNTISQLVDYGIEDLPMLAKRGHVRENILTEEQAQKLGYSINKKHFHGLGVKKYLEIINSMDNPLGVYQYTSKGKYNSDNFIVLTPIKINGKPAIVPIEINNNPGQYNKVEINYNKIKTAYLKNNINYINNLLKEGKIKEIFAESNSQKTSLNENNISQNNNKVNSNDILPINNNTQNNIKYSLSKELGDSSFSIDNPDTYTNYVLTKEDNNEIDNIVREVTKYVDYNYDEVDDQLMDEMIGDVPIIKQLEENEIDIDEYQYNILEKVTSKIYEELAKKF